MRARFEGGLVSVNGETVDDSATGGKFDRVEVSGKIVQARVARYLMLHKPLGVVSATVDEEHRTVIDLIEEEWAPELHLAGRLDRFTSGLVILTNDSKFSESLTEPGRKVGKRYLVETDAEITEDVVRKFEEGMWFAKEEVTTAPAVVALLGPRQCRLTIFEGKHHQVKRMFARFEIKVTALHREAIGDLELDAELKPGEWRVLSAEESGILS